jgi:hypothetical protein
VGDVEKILFSINNEKPPDIYNIYGKLLRMVANYIVAPICPIVLNLNLEKNICPQTWREAKVNPLPKNGKDPFTDSKS